MTTLAEIKKSKRFEVFVSEFFTKDMLIEYRDAQGNIQFDTNMYGEYFQLVFVVTLIAIDNIQQHTTHGDIAMNRIRYDHKSVHRAYIKGPIIIPCKYTADEFRACIENARKELNDLDISCIFVPASAPALLTLPNNAPQS